MIFDLCRCNLPGKNNEDDGEPMNALSRELQRLYFLPVSPGGTEDAPWPSADGMARVMVVSFARAADWPAVAGLYGNIQEVLGLPAPAVSVSGEAGYALWLALAEPQPVAQLQVFLAGLKRVFLADVPEQFLGFHPDAAKITPVPLPLQHPVTGRWSAFIDPGMGSMFAEESGLEMAPNPLRQAEMLAGLKCMTTADFQRVLATLTAENVPASVSGDDVPAAPAGGFSDPASFLMAVMNDPAVSMENRIRAAASLLAHTGAARHGS